jgi:hypothetical protein
LSSFENYFKKDSGQVEGRMDGWVDGQAVLRIDYRKRNFALASQSFLLVP